MVGKSVLVVLIELKFRWLVTWGKYEKEIRLRLPFDTPFVGNIGSVKDKGLSVSILIEQE